MAGMPYLLPPDVHWCGLPAWWVFLDLKADRYFCVRIDEAAPDIPVCGRMLDALVVKGLLTTDPQAGRPTAVTRLARATRDLGLGRWRARRQLSPMNAARAWRALIGVSLRMKLRPIAAIVDHVRRLRESAEHERGQNTGMHELRRRMAEFQSLRPWYPREYRCLFDSLAALEYLAQFGCVPQLVFGVQAEPFQAHCWLQSDATVVNDSLDHVRAYTPILIV